MKIRVSISLSISVIDFRSLPNAIRVLHSWKILGYLHKVIHQLENVLWEYLLSRISCFFYRGSWCELSFLSTSSHVFICIYIWIVNIHRFNYMIMDIASTYKIRKLKMETFKLLLEVFASWGCCLMCSALTEEDLLARGSLLWPWGCLHFSLPHLSVLRVIMM